MHARLCGAVVAAVAVTTTGCAGTVEPTPAERRQADTEWTAQFGHPPAPARSRRFSLDATWMGDSVLVTVRAHHRVTFGDSLLGATVYGYRDDGWHRIGDAGASLPATRVLRQGESAEVPVDVRGEGRLHRAAVHVVDDDGGSWAWVNLPPR